MKEWTQKEKELVRKYETKKKPAQKLFNNAKRCI